MKQKTIIKIENSYWGGADTLWGGDGGKKVPPIMGRGGDGRWGKDNGAGAGDRIPAPNPPHAIPKNYHIYYDSMCLSPNLIIHSFKSSSTDFSHLTLKF